MNLYEFCKKDKKINSLYWMNDIYNELWYVRWNDRELGELERTKTCYPAVFMMRDKEKISWGEFDFAGSLFFGREFLKVKKKTSNNEILNSLMDDMDIANQLIILRDVYRYQKKYKESDKVRDEIKALKHFVIYIEDRK